MGCNDGGGVEERGEGVRRQSVEIQPTVSERWSSDDGR